MQYEFLTDIFNLFFCALLKMLKRCIYAVSVAASWMFEQIGEVGANFSLQLSSRTKFAIAENQCEKHNQSS